MRLLICGSRTFCSRLRINRYIREKKPTVLISGGAEGPDTFAEEFAKKFQVDHQIYYAKWRPGGIYDNSAGYKRNVKMLKEGKPDLVAAFYDGEETVGTAMMIRLALEAGVEVEKFGLG